MAVDLSDVSTLEEYLFALVAVDQMFGRAEVVLQPLGLTVDGVLAGIREVDQERAYPEPPPEPREDSFGARNDRPSIGDDYDVVAIMAGPKARHWALVWSTHGLTLRQIAVLIGREPSLADALALEIERVLGQRSTIVNEALIIQLHRDGLSPIQIARSTGYRPGTVQAALKRLDIEPHRRATRVPDDIRNAVITMRNKGMTYPNIRKATGLTTNQVRSVLRYAAKAGLVKGYGE